jgi:UDP-N-acetylmuramoyl-tripeptide--D-alanyl-D-alanine ligase
VLSENFSVLQPQENYNTPIGIAKTILFSLTSKHQIFLTELGEYYRGDIRNLVRFVSPDYKILTPIGYAHLGKFKTQDNLENGLLELLTTNPKSDSLCVSTNKKIVLSHQIPTTKLDWYGHDDIVSSTVTRSGTEFTSPRYSDLPIYIPLFGKHNAINTLPAFWIGKKLGISNQEIIDRLSTIPYIPHRLEPTHVENNILLLDNGYNANPGSSHESLAVLEAINGSQKIICTPGFVDLGTYQEKENEEFGKKIAKICDLCIVITSVNHDAIIKGLLLGGMKKDSIISANSEIEGMNAIRERLLPSAVVLFENSVPQLYL